MAAHVVEFGSLGKPPEPDGRLDAPAFHRNHAAIWSALQPFLNERTGDVLELGSGTGQHAVAFAHAAPHIAWWPSEVNGRHLASIAAWRAHAELPNLHAPICIDLMRRDWAVSHDLPRACLAIVCINVLHISPWQVSLNLLHGAGRRLAPGGRLFVYGPFMRDGRHTAESNAAFDAGLRRDNPEWGVRDITELATEAGGNGLRLVDTVSMPANNFVLVFERTP